MHYKNRGNSVSFQGKIEKCWEAKFRKSSSTILSGFVEAVLQVALLTGLRNASSDQSQPVIDG